ncbi:PspC domain-containing protein [Mucilaginibacter sp. SP1R1]|uniref:PspC domain-containing protein n=1 Tax=Mucilaginibacter sp. SP1R1 TaxID=2723091 RepID=UPI00161E63A9|nr:PspC domain-containing protein [Mucilaginibacter sp. SP1R1]MBB6147514.1 phage shock protein PspC (stress-responsive transcriptional regulator) [Mucilaginibacter sp. SP1R1]
MEKKLYRDEHRKVIGGVCAGLADYFGVDIAIIRALFLITLLLKGGGLLIYLVLWAVLPKKDYNFYNPGVDYRVPPQDPFNPFGNVPPQPGSPFANGPKRQGASTVGIVFGVILIFIGASFLLNELHVFSSLYFGKLWPLILVATGFALMASGNKSKPWEKDNWTNTDNKEEVKDDTLNKEANFTKEDDDHKNPPPTV